jgi:hypothetical protein
MTNPNSAAQAATQHPIDEAIVILTEEADSLSECHTLKPGDWKGEPEAKARYDHVQAVVAALSKLRAPVADERAAVDPCGYVAVKVSAVDWLKDKFPALTIKAGLCERIGGRLYTITRLMRDHDAALASAPVDDAGNWQQYRLRGSNETAEQIIERERMAYADLLQSVMDKRRERASAPVAGEAQPSRQTLLDAIWRHGNARAMAEHNIAYRDEVRNTADALLALFDAAPQASAGTADDELVELGGTAPPVPAWLLKSARRISQYMATHCAGEWAIDGIQRRSASPAAAQGGRNG